MKLNLKLLMIGLVLLVSMSTSAKKLNVLIVTGGHDFDREPFFQMFDSFQDIGYTEIKHPEATQKLGTIKSKTFDAVVFYDMPKSISDAEKTNYHNLLKTGKGMVFLHHSLASYQEWPEFIQIIGGKYHEEPNSPASSTYHHDVSFKVYIKDPKHPVTKGISEFEIFDEVYGNTEVLQGVVPLLTTDHPESSSTIGWTHEVKNSRVVYLQPGHDKNAFFNPNYRKLVSQAIAYVAK